MSVLQTSQIGRGPTLTRGRRGRALISLEGPHCTACAMNHSAGRAHPTTRSTSSRSRRDAGRRTVLVRACHRPAKMDRIARPASGGLGMTLSIAARCPHGVLQARLEMRATAPRVMLDGAARGCQGWRNRARAHSLAETLRDITAAVPWYAYCRSALRLRQKEDKRVPLTSAGCRLSRQALRALAAQLGESPIRPRQRDQGRLQRRAYARESTILDVRLAPRRIPTSGTASPL